MKTYITSITLALSMAFVASAEVLEQWTFSEADGAQFSEMLSDKGTRLATVDKPSASVQNGKLKFVSSDEIDSIFLINKFAGGSYKTGVYEMSWTFTNAVFAATHEVKGKANAGFDFRNNSGTPYKGNDDIFVGGVRLSFENGSIQIQYQDSTTPRYMKLAKIERLVLPEPLHVRIRFDLDAAGEAGSMQVFLRLGEDAEINPLTDGVIPEGSILNGFRITQQITNGKTDWRKDDSISLDNWTLTKVK